MAERVEILAEVTGRPLRFEELSDEQARERLRGKGIDEEVIDYVLTWQFEQWARANAADFR